MGRENDIMLEFLRDNRRFADLFNGGVFEGKCIVKAGELQEAAGSYTEFRRENEANKHTAKTKTSTLTRRRDIKKRLKSGTELRVLAIEEQSLIDYTMPWRCMNYDALEYGRQVRMIQKKNAENGLYSDENERMCRFLRTDRLAPVYTVCLYHGTRPWDGPRNLREMMEFGTDEEKEFWAEKFSDYSMQLICVNELKDTAKFKSGLKELFSIMVYRDDREGMDRFLAQHEEYKRLDEETALVIGGMIGVKRFMENKDQYGSEGGFDMCQAIREMMQDSLNEGLQLGISQGLSQGRSEGVSLSAAIFRAVKNGITDSQEIATLCHCTVDEVEGIRKIFEI